MPTIRVCEGILLRTITANLPAIGAFRVNLHRESEQIINFFGDDELTRLGRIDHLGAATAAFPGINHKRLEYVLLQCAIAQIVAKLYKDNADLALANRVELSGTTYRVSSAEELLKCWALFGNIGHPNWTFATERVLMNGALKSRRLRSWLLSGAIDADLKKCAQDIIRTHDDRRARLVIALLRLKEERPHDRRKHLFRHMIRNFVLPQDNLEFSSPAARSKLNRLKLLHDQIQLLAMVTLDAYHSHSPVHLQLLPALQELAESATQTARLNRFLEVVRSTAGWLADEVYLHPSAVAVQFAYESRCSNRILKKFDGCADSTEKRRVFLQNILKDGFGQPKQGILEPLVRLTFSRYRPTLLGTGTRQFRISQLDRKIAVSQSTFASVEDNWFTGETHLDLLYNPRNLDSKRLGKTYSNLSRWLLQSIETESLETLRRIFRLEDRDQERLERQRVRVMTSRLKASERHLLTVVISLIRNMVPVGYSVGLDSTAEPVSSNPIGWRVVDSQGVVFDELFPRLADLRTRLSTAGNKTRALEVETTNEIIRPFKESLIAALLQPVIIRDSLGRTKDEWDGCILTVDDSSISLTVVEVKGGASKAKRSQEAFHQLADTRALLKSRYGITTKRNRIKNCGAALIVSF